MSFILDALKKSESERHRQSGPVLMDVRIAAPRRRVPVWAWVIAGVLAVNLCALVWILWLWPGHRADEEPAPATITAPALAVTPAPTAPGPASAPASVLPPPQLVATPAATEPAVTPAATAPTAAAPAPTAPMPAATPAQDIDITALPRVADMMASGISLPDLQLNLHVYDPMPRNRYVLINGARLREGDFTAEGVRVTMIAPSGVVVEWRGRQMFLNVGR